MIANPKRTNPMKRTYISPASQTLRFECEGMVATSGPQVSENETIDNSDEYLSRRKRSGWNSTLWAHDEE